MTKKSIIQKINSTSLLAIILTIANTIYLIEAIRTAPPIKNGEIGITFFPIVVSILLHIAAICLFLAGIREKSTLSFNLSKVSKPISVIFVTFIYVLIFKQLGYILSSMVYVLSMMLLFEDGKTPNKRKLLNIIYTVIIVLLIYLLYQKVFGVRLPIGEVF